MSRRSNPSDDTFSQLDESRTEHWFARRNQLQDELGEHPNGDWAWLWRTRIKVLNYLIDRYASDAQAQARQIKSASAKQTAKSGAEIACESTRPYDNDPKSQRSGPTSDLPCDDDRSRRLSSLHQTNEARRAEQPPIPPTPPPYPSKVIKLADLFAQRGWDTLPHDLQWLLESEVKSDELASRLASTSPEFDQIEDRPLARADAGYNMLRQVISNDMGQSNQHDPILSDDVIHAILREHGLDQHENA